MKARIGGCLGLVACGAGLLLLWAISGLPWWAVLYAVVFWVAMRIRLNARAAGEDIAPSEDGPRWATSRGGF